MLSKATIKLIHSLDSRKGRRETGLFVAEGHRLVGELMGHMQLHELFVTEEAVNDGWQAGGTLVTNEEMSRASLMRAPQGVLALFRIPADEGFSTQPCTDGLCLALDGVQDPGNLGTIIRLADWFGCSNIFCSQDTCDVWNPKVVQATMGGLARVTVHYGDLPTFLKTLPADVPVYGTSLQGDIIWETPLQAKGLVVMGNEGNGLSPEVDAFCTRRLLIPSYPAGRTTTESLNVAMATGIVLAEFRRHSFFS